MDRNDPAQAPLREGDTEQAEWDALERQTFSSIEFSEIAANLRLTGKASA